ncbi:hypothetical protein SUGI_0907150 [Cryptomeria japonica]|nr:hypothetical protein SUGI_0907150 [Cryptomeria japonica]
MNHNQKKKRRRAFAGLLMGNVGTSISESEGGLIQCTKFFSFKKEKKTEKGKKSKESEAKKIVKCSLLKSILRRLTLTKHLLPNIHTDLGNVSKKLSIAKTKLSCKISKDEFCRHDQSQLRICDIVSWNSFKEAQLTGNNHGASVDKGCILSKSATFPELREVNSFCAKEAGDLLQTSNANSLEIDVDCKKKKMELQSVMGESNSQSLDFSRTSSSSFDSCFDSEVGSISGEKLSSNNSFEESRRDKPLPPQGIVTCALESTGSSVCLSLDRNEYQVKDYQPGLRNGLDQSSWATTVCDTDDTADSYEKLHSSNNALTQDYVLSPIPTLKSLKVLQNSRDEESHVIISECMKDDDLRSVEMNYSSQEDEDEENVYSAHGLRQQNRDVHYHGENQEYASEMGCCVESKELSPVSVLEILFEEENSSFGPSSACRQITEHHLLQRLTKDALTLEHKSLGKEPSQSVYRTLDFSLWSEDNIDGSQIPNLIRISPQISPVQCQGEINWEQGGADEHKKEVLNSQEILSCLTDSNKREFQDMSCFRPSKRKEMPMQAGNLLFDCVKEVLEAPCRKQFNSGVSQEPWLKHCYVPEQLAIAICDQIYSWTETDTSVVENLVELAWKKEAEDWTKFWEETDEIGTEIEVDIFGLLIEELVADLACLQT